MRPESIVCCPVSIVQCLLSSVSLPRLSMRLSHLKIILAPFCPSIPDNTRVGWDKACPGQGHERWKCFLLGKVASRLHIGREKEGWMYAEDQEREREREREREQERDMGVD